MGNGSPQITTQTLSVLGAFRNGESVELSGADIRRMTGLQSGSLYPILFRLEEAGWLTSRWEEGNPSELRRPRKRLYQISGAGVDAARAAARNLSEKMGALLWAN